MGLSSSKQSTSSSSTAAPYSPAQPYIDATLNASNDVFNQQQPVLQGLSQTALDAYNSLAPGIFQSSGYVDNAQQAAQGIFNQGTGSNPGASTYASLMAGTTAPGTTTLANLANGGALAGTGALDRLASGNRLAGASTYGSIANSRGSAGDGTLWNLANGTAGSNPASSYDSDVLAGKYLDGSPFLQSQLDQAGDQATRAVNARFAGSGMGEGMSTPYADLLSRNVANAKDNILAANYTNERQSQDAASGRIASNYNTSQASRLAAATGLNNSQNATTQNRLAAASGLNAGQLGLGAQQLSAATALGSADQAVRANQLGAASALNNSGQASDQTRLAAAQAADGGYNTQIQQALAALGLTPSLTASEYAGLPPGLDLLNSAAAIPWYGVNAQAGALNTLAGRYGTTTGTGTATSSPSLWNSLQQGAGTALKLASFV